jgi:lipopolysaccharide export system permease protein
MTVAVFTFVLLLGNGLKDILALLINRQATLWGVFKAFELLIPFVLVFALPMGMLTAALLVFGRFSADQELTAARASGISLMALITPILILSLLLCGLSAWINMDIAPRSRVAYKSLLYEMGLKASATALPEERYVSDFTPYIFYIGRVEGTNLSDIIVCKMDTNQVPPAVELTIRAAHGNVQVINQQMIVKLLKPHMNGSENGALTSSDTEEKGEAILTHDLNDANPHGEEVKVSDMTYRQLQATLRDLDRSFAVVKPGKLSSDELRKQKSEMEKLKVNLTMPVLVQIHRQVASSFACFGFTLIGIPLGIRAHRRETNIGIAMALALVFIYYSFLIIAQSLQSHAELAPYLIFWLPNFLFQAVGAVMLWRANKGI